ncbi:MAG: exodeoxyribonuclease VII large subunit, partial [Sphingomonadales bacterium]|nr:exodeoxyribonuclease VII large subunit [Sphingomonadales bacterium]
RLRAARLAPALLHRRFQAAAAQLDAAARILQSLDPDVILAKGYVRVTTPDGATLTSRAAAAAQPALALHFRDGRLPVTPLGARAPARKGDAPEQGKLL